MLGSGSSGQSCSDTYRGNSALSEPETAALDAAIQTTNNVAFISIHSYSQYILLPWGYQSSKPSDYNTLVRTIHNSKEVVCKIKNGISRSQLNTELSKYTE